MRCENVQKLISPLLDRRMMAEERDNVLAHLESCRACSTQFESTQSLRAALRRLDEPSIPEQLSQKLWAIADEARVRTLARATSPAWLRVLGASGRTCFSTTSCGRWRCPSRAACFRR